MMLTQLACYQHSMVIVPMYDTLGEDALIHIVNQSALSPSVNIFSALGFCISHIYKCVLIVCC